MGIYLLQPPAENYWTGGYIYNRELARHSSLQLLSVPSDALIAQVQSMHQSESIILDSLYLYQKEWQQSWPENRFYYLLVHHLQSCDTALSVSERQIWAKQELESLRRAQGLIVTSYHMADYLQKKLPHKPLFACPPGVDLQRQGQFRQRRWQYLHKPQSESVKLLTVAHITARKGYLPGAKLLARLRECVPHLDWSWNIIGSEQHDAVYASEFRRFLQQAKLIDRVRFHGLQSPVEALNTMSEADSMFFPSLFETFGMVVLEALSIGLPVIAHDQGEMKRLIFEDFHGRVIPMLDLERSIREMSDFLLDRKQVHMAAEQLLQVKSVRDWQRVAEDFMQGWSRIQYA
ncbi:MAG: glycosyltransferase family 4 protein [Oligoflexus sp.]